MSESIKRPGYESRVNLHHDAEPRAKVVLEGVAIFFFYKDRAGFDGDRFNAVRLFRVISKDSAERDSLDESSAFLIEGAQWVRFRGCSVYSFSSPCPKTVSRTREVFPTGSTTLLRLQLSRTRDCAHRSRHVGL